MAISKFARSCPSQFLKYIEEILKNFDDITDYVDENVNIELIIAYQSLLVSIDKAEKANLSENQTHQTLNLARKLWMNDILPKFERIFQNSDLKIEVVNVLESIYGIINYFGRDLFIDNNSLERIFNMIKTLLEFKATCQIKNDEEDLEEDEIDHDAEILDHISDVLMITAEKLENDFHPILSGLMDLLKKYLSVKRSLGDRSTVFGCLADTLKYCKITAKFYLEFLLKIISDNIKENMKNKDDDLFRNMAFLIGVLFESNPDAAKDYFNACMNQLQTVYENSQRMGKDNVIASLCRISIAMNLNFSDENNSEIFKKIIDTVFTNCPLISDYHENVTVFKFIEYIYDKFDLEYYNKYSMKMFEVIKYLLINELKCGITSEILINIKTLLEKINTNQTIKVYFENFLNSMNNEEKEKFINTITKI